MLPHPKNVTSLGSKVGTCGNPTSVIRERHTPLGFASSLPTIILLIVIIPKWLTCNMHCTYVISMLQALAHIPYLDNETDKSGPDIRAYSTLP